MKRPTPERPPFSQHTGGPLTTFRKTDEPLAARGTA